MAYKKMHVPLLSKLLKIAAGPVHKQSINKDRKTTKHLSGHVYTTLAGIIRFHIINSTMAKTAESSFLGSYYAINEEVTGWKCFRMSSVLLVKGKTFEA